MRVFVIQIERTFDVPIEGAYGTNPRKHRRASVGDHLDQRFQLMNSVIPGAITPLSAGSLRRVRVPSHGRGGK
jgi:hypothetical protein